MLRETPHAERFLAQLPVIKVENIGDESSGRLRFESAKPHRRLGVVAAKVQYQDEDGIPVLASLYLDEDGELYELDNWKVDSSQLMRIPNF